MFGSPFIDPSSLEVGSALPEKGCPVAQADTERGLRSMFSPPTIMCTEPPDVQPAN